MQGKTSVILEGRVLGTRLNVVDYKSALEEIVRLARGNQVSAVAAANAHLLAEAVDDTEFGEVLSSFDLVVPDGMPLVWALQLDGHAITERVYGPYLMRFALENTPRPFKHFLFGGTSECLALLSDRARELNKNIEIAGTLSPPFGCWDAAEEGDLIDQINAAGADFVWVALGGVRQETWIANNRHRFKKGVFLAVGDAFALVAGLRSFAPAWMQRCGLTWIYRLAQEPSRLFGRYLKYNTRFGVAFLLDRLRKAYGSQLQ